MKRTYQIESGKVQGFQEAEDVGSAFRKLMYCGKFTKKDWGMLARFREVVLDKFKIVKRDRWNYQEPQVLYFSYPKLH